MMKSAKLRFVKSSTSILLSIWSVTLFIISIGGYAVFNMVKNCCIVNGQFVPRSPAEASFSFIVFAVGIFLMGCMVSDLYLAYHSTG